ncbi:MAG: FAD-binding protein, partial [Dehalococcoidia bacterium]|nr:FAD-binding protein [Dehalococcoidia bacterium]
METQRIEADVLCVGGGIAGLMAAIRAGELGAKVVVADKSNTLHSGKGGCGNDHFLCYIPEVHSKDLDAVIEAMLETQQADNFQGLGKNRIRVHMATSFDIVKLWDSWGIPMKYQGKWEFAGHGFPRDVLFMLKYQGLEQKKVLTKQALARGVKIVNRVQVTDLLVNNRLIGAIGIGTREDRVVEFRAKSIVLGTGGVERLYPNPTPGLFRNRAYPQSQTGDGRIMAYRAGAELMGLEMPHFHAGPKYFARSGQATWIGVYRDPQGKPIGPFVQKPDKKYGDVTPEVKKTVLADYEKSGRGPVYMDGNGVSDEDYDYMLFWMQHEGLQVLTNHMKEEGIDHRKRPVEFMTYDLGCRGRIVSNEKAETSLPGLYTAGDEVANGISNAAIFGWLAGENAATYAKNIESPSPDESGIKIAEKINLIKSVRAHRDGPDWKEVNIALNQIMHDYCWNIRSENLLNAGTGHLRRLKKRTYDTVVALNQHELGRCLEVYKLMDLGELVFFAAKERK